MTNRAPFAVWSSTSSLAAGLAASLLAVPLLLGWSGCQRESAIILVIDTDLAVPAELDRLRITIAGPTRTEEPVTVSVAGPDVPPFPRTMKLRDAGSESTVSILVEGLHGTNMALVVSERVTTQFVAEDSRMVRVVLTAACLGVTCQENGQTCSGGRCVPFARAGASLPSWKGTAPRRPEPLPGEERLVWSGGWRSCAPRAGTLFCWGENDKGQLGHPAATDTRIDRRLPVVGLVPSASAPTTTVALGHRHSCVCDATTGKAYCWGDNQYGQVGALGASPQLTPVEVPGVTNCKLIAAGGGHTCVVDGNRTVSCWGRNHQGQAGQPEGQSMVTVPQQVPGLDRVSDIRLGESFSCAISTNGGAVYCWGTNSTGELGDGTQTSRSTPGRVDFPAGTVGSLSVTELALGRYFACAQTERETVYCWGENTDGMVGGTATPITRPTQKMGIDDSLHIAAGHQHACTLRRGSRRVACWGGGQYGILGNGSKANSDDPVEVLNIENATALSLGMVHGCARSTKGLFCWGQNVNGQLGAGAVLEQPSPVPVLGF